MTELSLESLGLFGVIIILCQTIVEIVKAFVFKNKNGNSLTKAEHEALMRLDNIHNRHDQNGIPLWYVPRSWEDTQKSIVDLNQKMLNTLKENTKTLGRIEKKF
jgi:hypothetical protein